MVMDKRQAFKVGFLQKCAELGLDNEETIALVKKATEMIKSGAFPIASNITGAIDKTIGVGANVANTLGHGALIAGAFGPMALGGGAGYLAARATDVSEDDIDAIKKRELANEYLRLARTLREKKKTYRLPESV